MQLRSGVAVAVVWAGGCSSNSAPSLGTSVCHRCRPQKKKKKKERKKKKRWMFLLCLQDLWLIIEEDPHFQYPKVPLKHFCTQNPLRGRERQVDAPSTHKEGPRGSWTPAPFSL